VPLYSASCFIHTRSQLPEDNKQPPSTHVLRRVKTFSTPLRPVAGCAGSGRSRAAVFHQRVTIQEPTESRRTPFVVEHKVAVQSRPTADRSHSIRRERPPTHRPPAALHGRRLVSISVHRPWITGSTCYSLTYYQSSSDFTTHNRFETYGNKEYSEDRESPSIQLSTRVNEPL